MNRASLRYLHISASRLSLSIRQNI
jgi:hypothetical protein